MKQFIPEHAMSREQKNYPSNQRKQKSAVYHLPKTKVLSHVQLSKKYKVHVSTCKSKTETCTDVYLAVCMLSTFIFILCT